eukprot:SAG31_NODE_25398_length_462_cov_0.845730_1_plen_73_part_01
MAPTLPLIAMLGLLGSIVNPSIPLTGRHNISSLSASRFPMEGIGAPVTLCSDPPLPSAGLPLRAQVNQPGTSL